MELDEVSNTTKTKQLTKLSLHGGRPRLAFSYLAFPPAPRLIIIISNGEAAGHVYRTSWAELKPMIN